MATDWRRISLVAVALAACSPKDKSTKPSYDQVEVLPIAAGATRLLCSQNGRHVVAELGGDWRNYAPDPEEVPPVLKLISLPDGAVQTTVNGWALGAPDNAGELLYLEEVGEEYRYQLRSTRRPQLSSALTPPGGYWLPRAGLRVPGGPAVLVLWKPRSFSAEAPRMLDEQLWIAVIDPATVSVRASKELPVTSVTLAGHRFDEGIAINPAGSHVYLVEAPAYQGSANWTIMALDLGDLHESWRSTIPGQAKTGGGERNKRAVKLVTDGRGNRLAVFYGSKDHDAIRAEAIFVLDTSNGATRATRDATQLDLPDLAGLYRMAPVPSSERVALMYRYHHREGQGESPAVFLRGVWLFDQAKLDIAGSYQVTRSQLGDSFGRIRSLDPHAMTVSPTGLALVAPKDFRWVETWMEGNWPKASVDGTGLDTAAVRGLVANPHWHRLERPRVAERRATVEHTGLRE